MAELSNRLQVRFRQEFWSVVSCHISIRIVTNRRERWEKFRHCLNGVSVLRVVERSQKTVQDVSIDDSICNDLIVAQRVEFVKSFELHEFVWACRVRDQFVDLFIFQGERIYRSYTMIEKSLYPMQSSYAWDPRIQVSSRLLTLSPSAIRIYTQ